MLEQSVSAVPPGNFEDLERIDIKMLEKFWPEFYAKNVPAIVVGAMDGWAAMGKWTPEFFASLLDGFVHPVRDSDDEVQYTFVNHTKTQLQVSEHLRALKDSIRAPGGRPYFGNIPLFDKAIAEWFKPLHADYKFPDVASDRVGQEIRLWIGAAGQKSTVHNDSNPNFNAQVFGQKSFILYSPEQYECMYAKKISDETWVSPVEWERPDYTVHPKYAEANGYRVLLQEGDMLYMPAFWWHAARAESVCINLNEWILTTDVGKWVQ